MKKISILNIILAVLTLSFFTTSIVILPSMIQNIRGKEINYVVEVYETTGNKSKLDERQSDIVFDDVSRGDTLITINQNRLGQDVIGFGAAMSHAAAYNIQNSQFRDDMIKDFFDPNEGAGFNVVRIPIGATDYSPFHFTLNDSETPDVTLEKFNVDYDLETIIPVLETALEVNPNLEFVAAPWSAPAWMKDTNSLNSGSLLEMYEEVYANYLLKFILTYQAYGISIDYLSIQNEPYHGTGTYPVMFMDYDQQARIIKILGPMLESNSLNTKIIAWDHNTDVIEFAQEILKDREVSRYVSGTAFHGYYGDRYDLETAFEALRHEFPNKDLYFTEVTAGDWNVDFASNISYSLNNVILATLNSGGKMVLYWNLVLNQDNGPFAGGAGNSHGLFTLSNQDNFYQKHAEYYALSHLSKHLKLDSGPAYHLESESSNEMIVTSAYRRADGKTVLVVTNLSDIFPEVVEIAYEGRQVTYTIQPQSVVTFVW